MVSLIIGVAANEIVGVLLGSKWSSVSPLLGILVLAVTPTFLSHLLGVILDSRAELRIRLSIQSISVVILGALIYVGHGFGLAGIAYAVVTNEVIRCAALLVAAKKVLCIKAKELWLCLISVLLMGIVSSLIFSTIRWLRPDDIGNGLAIALDVPAGLTAIIVAVLLAMPSVSRLTSARELLLKAPAWAKRFLLWEK
jgi:hypothetical protein